MNLPTFLGYKPYCITPWFIVSAGEYLVHGPVYAGQVLIACGIFMGVLKVIEVVWRLFT